MRNVLLIVTLFSSIARAEYPLPPEQVFPSARTHEDIQREEELRRNKDKDDLMRKDRQKREKPSLNDMQKMNDLMRSAPVKSSK